MISFVSSVQQTSGAAAVANESSSRVGRCLLLTVVALFLRAPSSVVGQDLYFEGHAGAVTDVSFIDDGPLAVSSGADGTVRIWNRHTAREVRRFEQHTGPVHCVAVSPDQQLVASGGQDNSVRFWPTPTTTASQQWTLSAGPISRLATTSAGRTLFAVRGDQLWNAEVATPTTAAPTADESHARQLWAAGSELTAWHVRPDGVLHLIGTSDGRVIGFSPVLQTTVFGFSASDKPIVAVTQAGEDVVTVDASGSGHRWKLPAKTNTGEAALPRSSADFSLDVAGSFRILMNADGSRMLVSDQQQLKTLTSDGRELTSRPIQSGMLLAVSQDAQKAIIRLAADDGAGVQIAEYRVTGDEPPRVLHAFASATAAAYSADGRRLVVAAQDGTLSFFAPTDRDVNGPWLLQQQIRSSQNPTAVMFAGGGNSLLVGHRDGVLSAWRCPEPQQLRQVNHSGPVYDLEFTPDGRFLITAGADQTVRVWTVKSGQQKFQMRGHQGSIYAVAVHRDGGLAYSSGADGTIRVWDILSGRQIKQLSRLSATMYTLQTDSADRHLLAAGGDRNIYRIDLQTGETVQTLSGHEYFIHGLCRLPSGDQLLSYGYGGSLRFWNLKDGRPLSDHRFGLVGNAVDVSADGKRIALATGRAGVIVMARP